MSFSSGASGWWWRARTAKPPRPPCWRGCFPKASVPLVFSSAGFRKTSAARFALGAGREFILEGDEYDTAFFDKGPKFLHYFPDSVILTSVEFDHADIYKNLDEVKTAFKRLVNLIPQRGLLVAWDGHANVDDCVSRAFCRVERYGLASNRIGGLSTSALCE